VLLDRESRSEALDADAAHGLAREPVLKVLHIARALDLRAGDDAERRQFHVQDLDVKLGEDPHNAPSVFGFFSADFQPTGPVLDAGLVAPEAQLLAAPQLVGYVNAASSLVKQGLCNCDDGAGLGGWTEQIRIKGPGGGQPEWHQCGDIALKLRWRPECWGGETNVNGATASDVVDELDLLLTGGRMSATKRAAIIEAYAHNAFEFHNQWLSLPDAEAFCAASGGRVAAPCDADENARLRGVVPPGAKAWIGITDAAVEGTWDSLDGTRDCTYTNWAEGEAGTTNRATWQDCAIVDDSGYWYDVTCDATHQFVCESELASLVFAERLFVVSPEFAATNRNAAGEPRAADDEAPPTGIVDDYKAIVYLFLANGADSFSAVVPLAGCGGETDLHEQYLNVRSGVAITEGLLEIAVEGQPCATFGVHPATPTLKKLYDAEELTFLANVGVLIEPIADKAAFDAARQPPSLFAHNTQTTCVQNVHAQDLAANGVLGRIGDALDAQGGSARAVDAFSLSGAEPKVLEGSPGLRRAADVLSSEGVPGLVESAADVEAELAGFASRLQSSIFAETYAARTAAALARSAVLRERLAAMELVLGECAGFGSDLGLQLKQVARLIRVKDGLGAPSAIFYVSQSGYDTHSDGGPKYAALSGDVDAGMACFSDELKAQGLWDAVVVVSASEFGRTLTSNGQGTDHAWGGNYWVAGGGIRGGQMLGEYPDDLTDAGPRSLGQGRLIPKTPWEAVWAPVASWFGVDAEHMAAVLPNLQNFDASHLLTQADLFKDA